MTGFRRVLFRSAQAKNATKEDYKGDSKFASHLKSSAGVSSFSRNRTLREQREYLPAFACREDILRTIRDNQGAICSTPSCMLTDVPSSRSGNCDWRNRLGKDDAARAISLRRWILWSRYHRLHATSSCGCHVRRKACQRGDRVQTWWTSGLRDPV